LYFFLPLVVAALAHFSNPRYKEHKAWGYGNDIGLAVLIIFLLFLYYGHGIAPSFIEFLEHSSRGARRGLFFTSVGFIFVLYPHVIKNHLNRGKALEKKEFSETKWYKAIGVLMLIFSVVMGLSHET